MTDLDRAMFAEHADEVVGLALLAAGQGARSLLGRDEAGLFVDRLDDLRAVLVSGSVHTEPRALLDGIPLQGLEHHAIPADSAFWPCFREIVELSLCTGGAIEDRIQRMRRLTEHLLPWAEEVRQCKEETDSNPEGIQP